MIAPDMGTMLSFLFTDAKFPAKVLQSCLTRAVDRSFNCISVDGDTSTSDTVLLSATGQVKRQPKIERANDPLLRDFRAALEDMTGELARMIVCDGAKKDRLLTCDVIGAESQRAARNIGRSIVDSTLVRVGIAGAEPRAGRIVMAVGKAGERADHGRLGIAIGGCANCCGGRNLARLRRQGRGQASQKWRGRSGNHRYWDRTRQGPGLVCSLRRPSCPRRRNWDAGGRSGMAPLSPARSSIPSPSGIGSPAFGRTCR